MRLRSRTPRRRQLEGEALLCRRAGWIPTIACACADLHSSPAGSCLGLCTVVVDVTPAVQVRPG